jgi:ATP-dependent helicase/nuclease subunit A
LEKSKVLYHHGEHGTEWGAVIHLLLETAMSAPGADLGSLARAALSEQGLDPALAENALETVASVTKSEIWKRALESPRRMVEAPFQRLVPDEGANGPMRGTILRGVIDLAFLDENGWVIVDYKTDRVAKERMSELADIYRPQVISYAEAWKQITGETVSEVGLYFTHTQSYGYRHCRKSSLSKALFTLPGNAPQVQILWSKSSAILLHCYASSCMISAFE